MSWNDAASYRYTANHTLKEWGWEFIRRDSRYHTEWAEALVAFERSPPKQRLLPYLMATDVSQYSDDDTSAGTLNLNDPADIDTFLIPHDGAMKWGLRYYQNPRSAKLAAANVFFVKMLHRGNTTGQEVEDEVMVEAGDHSLVAVIDLKRPIAPQLEAIQKRAKQKQSELKQQLPSLASQRVERVGSQDKARWITYLRCIDAKFAEVTPTHFAPVLFPSAAQGSKAKWDETRKQINEIAAKHYRLFMG